MNHWTYGEKKDAERRRHPLLIPYADLPKTEEDKEFTYDDLNGMEYKAMEADREKNMVIVTYLDDGEEKTREYLME